jgi:hypothetical protein
MLVALIKTLLPPSEVPLSGTGRRFPTDGFKEQLRPGRRGCPACREFRRHCSIGGLTAWTSSVGPSACSKQTVRLSRQ